MERSGGGDALEDDAERVMQIAIAKSGGHSGTRRRQFVQSIEKKLLAHPVSMPKQRMYIVSFDCAFLE